MSTTTRTRKATKPAEFYMTGDQLLAAAMVRTEKGNLTAGAQRARKEIERRDAKRDRKVVVAPAAKVTEVEVDDLVKQARRVANRIAAQTAGEVAEPGDIVRTKINLRRDLLTALDNMGAEEFLAHFGSLV